MTTITTDLTSFFDLPLESIEGIADHLSIRDLGYLRSSCRNFKEAINHYVLHELQRLRATGHPMVRDLLGRVEKMQTLSADSAWETLGVFKRTYPFLCLDQPLGVSITSAAVSLSNFCQSVKTQLVNKDPQLFAELAGLEGTEAIQTWLNNPANLQLLQTITQLSFRENNLSVIPSELHLFSNLKELDLSHNQIADITPGAFNLQHLEELELNRNQIRAIAPRAFNLPNLQILDLSRNQIADIASEVFNLPNLLILDLSHNQIADITPETLNSLQDLLTLDLSHNQIADIVPPTHNPLGNAHYLFVAILLFIVNQVLF